MQRRRFARFELLQHLQRNKLNVAFESKTLTSIRYPRLPLFSFLNLCIATMTFTACAGGAPKQQLLYSAAIERAAQLKRRAQHALSARTA